MKWVFHLAFVANVAVQLLSLVILPDRVATHFGLGGNPDGWSSKGTSFVLFLVLLVPMYVLLACSSRLTLGLPAGLVNLPNKKYWLAEENRPELKRRLDSLMAQFGTALFAFFFCISCLTIQANLSDPVRLNEPLFFTGLALFLGYTVLWCVQIFLSFRVPQPLE